jgi:acyl carrier protein
VRGSQPMKSIEQRIRDILVSQLDVDTEIAAKSGPQTPLIGRGIGLDSVEAMALAVGIEEAFDIEIPDEDLTTDLFQSIAALAKYVLKKQSQRQPNNARGGLASEDHT